MPTEQICFSCAPMEGLTGQVFRQTLLRHFPGDIRFFSPFISPTSSPSLDSREMRDVQPEDNKGVDLIPQILSNRAEDFLFTARKLEQLGYREVNLNLGCPSGTVTARGRGAGFLGRYEDLKQFLDRIFLDCPLPISVKTRLGVKSPDEFPALLSLFNCYPVKELIIHPRVREDFYRGPVRKDSFALAAAQVNMPLCYNGNIFTAVDFGLVRKEFPSVRSFMVGRGLIANPALIRELSGGAPIEKDELYSFHNGLMNGLKGLGWDDRVVLCHMKEYWYYMSCLFTERHKQLKRIGKAQSMSAYLGAVEALFRQESLVPGQGFCI